MGSDGADGRPAPEAGAQAALAYGWGTLRGNLGPLLAISAVYVAVEAALGFVGPAMQMVGAGTASVTLVEVALALAVSAPLGAGLWLAYLETTRGTSPEVGDLLDGYDRFADIVLAAFIVALAVGIGLLLLILPGIYIAIRLAFVPLLVMDEEMGAWEAVQESGERTGGESLGLLLLLVATVVILFAGLLLLVVGIIPALAWVGVSWAGYYRALTETAAGGGTPSEAAAGA